MSSVKTKKLSIIIPAYNQEKTIIADLKNILSVLEQIHYDYEVVLVVDGKTDKTYEVTKKARLPNLKAYVYNSNHGKGYAVRYGMARCTGDIVGFIDSGADLNPAGLQMLLAHFEWYNADIIVGSKWHPVSKVKYPYRRKFLSMGYGLYVKLLFGLRIRDTQLGMKFFRRRVLENVLPRLLVKKYASDIEMLAVADRIGFNRIYEAPIELNWNEINSSVSNDITKSVWDMFWDTLAVFYRLKILKYYDDGNKRKWRYDKDLEMRVNIG
jgi:glycosyltransferase involved in cell wall biosynthesis